MENIWNVLLKLKEAVQAFSLPIHNCWMHLDTGVIAINESPSDFQSNILIVCAASPPIKATVPTFVLTEVGNIKPLYSNGLTEMEMLFFKKYLPYCFLSLKAKKLKRAITITHFAQTLDAKIATNTGDSKWIGNAENLTHAHRMRAICDGVLVGSRTVEADNPKLNVRHVSGNNPVRIVLGNPDSDFKSLLACSNEKILVFGKEKLSVQPPLESIVLPKKCPKASIEPIAILTKLFTLGIHSVYIEGGATTTSNFVNSKAVDILQLHIAPMIFGSGKASIVLPNIEAVNEAISFKEYNFLPFGDSMMFTGFLN
ncbi:MAG: RibD family protein [Saprospiraceae bacterium]